jgi:membrane protease YdiL (CAAX protease family)
MKTTKMNHNGWLRILGIIIPFCISIIFFQYIVGVLSGYDLLNFEVESTIERRLLIIISFLSGTLFIVWLFNRYVDKASFSAIGLSFQNRFNEIFLGFVLDLAIMAIGFVILWLMGEVVIIKTTQDWIKLSYAFLLFLGVALAEEVLFRGYILKNLMVSFSPNLALLISSILFSLMHGFNPNTSFIGFTNLLLAGILLGLPYLYTRNLMFPIALHFSWNFFQSLLGFNVSGSSSYSLIEIDIQTNSLLNGGAFGFEGSILAVVAHIIAIMWVWKYYQK